MPAISVPFKACARSVAALSLCLFAAEVRADNWPQWRGPTGNGLSTEKNVPIQWTEKENVAWRLALPGRAGATPIVWGDRIFLTSVDGENLVLMCINTGGTELWRRTVSTGNKIVRGDEGDAASPSPVTDGKHVWATMGTGDIACFDFDGKKTWKLDLEARYGQFHTQFGMTSTPVLYEDRLLFQFIHGNMRGPKEEAFVLGLDKLTGKELWKRDRFTKAHTENRHSYASPIMYQDDHTTLFVTHGGDYVVAYDVNDGREIWRRGGLNPHDDPKREYHPTLRFVASPVAGEGIIVVPTAKQQKVIAIRPDGKGDITDDESALVWERPRDTPDVPSPLIHDGLVYLCRENGNLICLDAKTGKEHYEKRTYSDRYRASPVYADGHIYVTSRRGVITVVKAGPEFEMTAQNSLGEEMSASPAISNGTLYLRTFDALWAIRK